MTEDYKERQSGNTARQLIRDRAFGRAIENKSLFLMGPPRKIKRKLRKIIKREGIK